MCAAEQNLFWEYHNVVIANWNGENQGAFTPDRLTAFAQVINLDMNAFATCFAQNQYQSIIDQDLARGKAISVSAVPFVLVNGTAIRPGEMPGVKDIQKGVDKALTKP